MENSGLRKNDRWSPAAGGVVPKLANGGWPAQMLPGSQTPTSLGNWRRCPRSATRLRLVNSPKTEQGQAEVMDEERWQPQLKKIKADRNDGVPGLNSDVNNKRGVVVSPKSPKDCGFRSVLLEDRRFGSLC